MWLARLRGLALVVAACLLVSLAIAWPLWALATANRRLYTVLALSAIAASLLTAILRTALRRRRERAR